MNKNKDKILELLNILKDYDFKIRFTGSSFLSFINHPTDEDIILIFNNEEDKISAKNLFKSTYDIKELRKLKLDFHFSTLEFEIKDLKGLPFPYLAFLSHDVYDKDLNYIESIGLEVDEFLKYKTIYKEVFLERINMWLDRLKENKIDDKYFFKLKLFYQIYTTLCFLNNKSFNLTEEQIENINILHDREESTYEKRKELITKLIEDVKEI